MLIISFSFSNAKETEKSEENTIYLFDFEPNIRDFQESIECLLQSIIMTCRFRLLKNRPRICGQWLKVGHGGEKKCVPVIEYKFICTNKDY